MRVAMPTGIRPLMTALLLAQALVAIRPAGASEVDPFLKRLAPDALVVVGAQAAPELRKAAEELAAALRAAGGPEGNLVDADRVNADLELAATHHLLAVGTVADNRVLERLQSHWYLDRDRAYAAQPPIEPYMPASGWVAAGYGEWPKGTAGVGYCEWDRNPYWHYASSLDLKAPGEWSGAKRTTYRQLVRLSGSDSAGAVAAVRAFLAQRLLTGVIPPGGQLPGTMTPWSIDTAHFAPPATAPAWVPRGSLTGAGHRLDFAGWHLADSFTFAGSMLNMPHGRPRRNRLRSVGRHRAGTR